VATVSVTVTPTVSETIACTVLMTHPLTLVSAIYDNVVERGCIIYA